MTLGLGVALVGAPLVVMLAIAFAIREQPVRSPGSAAFQQQPTTWWAALVVVATAGALFAAGEHARAATFDLALVALSVTGAGIVERTLLSTIGEISYSYVNPADWPDGRRLPGPRWRYQMRARYVHDPEWVDCLALEMIEVHPTFEAFRHAVKNREFPDRYDDEILGSKLWGPAFPTVAGIMDKNVAGELFHPRGRFKADATPDEIYGELHELARGDRRALMDRWQYYWCLRNLNLVDRLLGYARGWMTVAALVGVGAIAFGAGVIVTAGDGFSADTALRAEAAGALFWLLLVCGGASIFIIGVFRGTGTFSIARPTRGTDFDPLWTRIIQVGILAFAVSFVVYGIGFPFLLEPSALEHFTVDRSFLVYAAGSFLFCFSVFVVHTFGVHNLMRASRDNALDRASADLNGGDPDETTLDHFKDVRAMRVWPLRSSTVFQLAGGILLPVAAQALLIYSGLS